MKYTVKYTCLEIFVNINTNNVTLFSKKSRLQQLQSCSVKNLYNKKLCQASISISILETLIHPSLCQINISV